MEIDLDLFEPRSSTGKPKLTVQKSGRLGFNKVAKEELNLDKFRFCKIGKNKKDTNDQCLYMILAEQPDSNTFSIGKSGDYFYIKAEYLLDDLKIQYADENKTYIYDITELKDIPNVLKLSMRIINKK